MAIGKKKKIVPNCEQNCLLSYTQLKSSSGFCWSSRRTCVNGKWPRLPLHSPSHWPLTLIFVTFTSSPTCRRRIRTTLYFQLWMQAEKLHSWLAIPCPRDCSRAGITEMAIRCLPSPSHQTDYSWLMQAGGRSDFSSAEKHRVQKIEGILKHD